MMSPHHRRSFMSNEDYTQKISHSIYVTNFPDSINSRDLWRECNVTGTVVDHNLDWATSPFANKVRLKRSQKPVSPLFNGKPKNSDNGHSDSGHRMSNSPAHLYTNVVNGAHSSANPRSLISTSPALVLDDNCIIAKDFTKHAMGRVKDVNSIPNLKIILHDEGFVDVKLKYLGGMWVMFEFEKEETKTNMLTHTGVNSWFHTIKDVIHDFASDERIAWVDIKGVPLNAWSSETFSRIGKNGGRSFKIIVKGKVFMIRAKELFTWNPSFVVNKETSSSSDDESVQGEMHKVKQSYLSEEEEGEFKASDVEDLLEKKKSGGVLHVPSPSLSHPPGFTPVVNPDIENDIVHNKGDANGPAGYNEKEVIKSWHKTKNEWIKELSINHKLNFIAIQETKMDTISYMDVKLMWGNSNYDFVCSDSLGNSGGILCIWETSIFKKDHVTISDNFVAIYGTWLPIVGMVGGNSYGILSMRFVLEKKTVDQGLTPPGARDLITIITSPGIVDVKLEAIHDELTAIDKELDCGMATDTSLARRQELKRQLQDIKVKEDVDSIQKSKVKWAIEGDENSSWRKIRVAVWNCGDNKSPGPDSYTFEFFKKYWGLIGSDFCEASAFITERQILDGPFIINEILNWCKRKCKKAMLFKVNFAKAYDSVRWDYLNDVLVAFGFGSKVVSMILCTFCFSKASILVNVVTLNFCRVVQAGMFKGIRLNSSISVSHLFYADDALIIGEWSSDNILGGIINVLKCFYCLGINKLILHKESALGVGVIQAIYEGDSTLRDDFPRMYVLELDKQISVADKIVAQVDVSFQRPVRGGIELNQFNDLVSFIDSVSLSSSHNRCVCNASGDGNFRVKDILNSSRYVFLCPSSLRLTSG
ncbi:hypothetical protein Tco_1080460 [Tanacetum coccineum]|uniref:RNA-directed DNA polymerase, eukaryota n=1 Tax=Tanacetum coccineum TaxID=301880 RepID=A0ABQ5HUU5_9ASTR